MLSMTQIKNIIKMYFEEGKNISQIERGLEQRVTKTEETTIFF